MSAPERIWVIPWERNEDGPVWEDGDMLVSLEPGYDPEIDDSIAFVRADIYADLAAKHRKAIELLNEQYGYPIEQLRQDQEVDSVSVAVAQARREARDEALRECVAIIEYEMPPKGMWMWREAALNIEGRIRAISTKPEDSDAIERIAGVEAHMRRHPSKPEGE